MRHRNSRKRLSGPSDHAHAELRNLAISLISHGQIRTTIKRAKVLRPFVEKLITVSRNCATAPNYARRDHYFRLLVQRLHNKRAAQLSARIWGPFFADRPGGYTRIVRAGFRAGDNAELAIIEFVLSGRNEESQITHKDLIQQERTYVPRGIKLIDMWRSLGFPRVSATSSARSENLLDFRVSASCAEMDPEKWPTQRGKMVPMVLSVMVLASKGATIEFKGEAVARSQQQSGLFVINISPPNGSASVMGTVIWSTVADNERFCWIVVDGPSGERFHANALQSE